MSGLPFLSLNSGTGGKVPAQDKEGRLELPPWPKNIR